MHSNEFWKVISQKSKLTLLMRRNPQIDCLAVEVVEGREILSKNAHLIWEISLAKSLSEISFDEIIKLVIILP